MSYIGTQYGFGPKHQMTDDASSEASQSSGEEFGLQMPRGYHQQVNNSTIPKPGENEQRLVMLAKHPNATDADIESARFKREKRKQQQQQEYLGGDGGSGGGPIHQQQKESPASNVLPVDSYTGETYENIEENRQQQFQQGGYVEHYEERAPPSSSSTDPYQQSATKTTTNPSFLGGIFANLFTPSAPTQDAQSVGGASKDNSYAMSYASEATKKISNVDEKARARRLRKEEGKQTMSDRCGSCFHCLFKTKVGVVFSAFVVAIILAGVLTVGAALGGNAFGTNDGDSYEDNNIETWIPRPITEDDDLVSLSPTLPPTTTGRPTATGPTPNPTPQPTPVPTPLPTPQPTPRPTSPAPTTIAPTRVPTKNPTPSPTDQPTLQPTTSEPSMTPTTSAPTFILRDLQPLGSPLSGTQAEQKFGYSVALSKDGLVLAVGIPYTSVDTIPTESSKVEAGMVQVYEWLNNEWAVRGPALIGRNELDRFGSAIAMNDDGSILVVSEPTYKGAAGDRSGNVRTFVYGPGNRYTPLGNELEGVAASDHFGISIAMSGDGRRLAVGAPYHDNSNTSSRLVSGQVRVFELQNDNWVPIGDPLAGDSHFDWFGWKLDLSDNGDMLCVGAPRNLEYGGYVHCYQYTTPILARTTTGGGRWELLGGKIQNSIPPLRYDDNFGHSLRISGNRVAIGCPGKNIGELDSGLVVVYEYDETTKRWKRFGNVITSLGRGTGHQLGFSLDLDRDTLVVGTPGKDNRGQVELYYYNSSNDMWETDSDPLLGEIGSNFGFSVHMTYRLAVGSAVTGGNNSGRVDVFHKSS